MARELCVGGQQRNALDESLGQEQTVEGVLVQGRKGVNAHRMLAGHRQLEIAVEYPAGASFTNPEESSDLGFAHPVEVIGHRDLAGQETQTLRRGRSFHRGHSDQRLAGFCDHEGLTLDRLVDQLRELSPRLMDVDDGRVCGRWFFIL